MAILSTKKRAIEYTLKYIFFSVLIIVLLFPSFYMVMKSLMTLQDANSTVVKLFPSKITFENYSVFGEYAKYFLNSLVIVVINAVMMPLVTCVIAYPLARSDFHGKRFMFSLILATSMIPGAVLSIPQYQIFVRLRLTDTLASQFVGSFFGGSGMQIFLAIQFMRAIPIELDEAAKIDGANKFRTFAEIVMPLCFNICAYLAVGMAIAKWNDFQGPLIYLHTDAKRTIAVAFYYHFGSSGDASLLTNVKMAMAVCMTVFPALLFFCFQRQMIGGIKIGAVKG